MAASTLRQRILEHGVPARQTKPVEMPEWGDDVTVYARQFLAADTEAIARLVDAKNTTRGTVTAHIIIRGVVDQKGDPVFSREDVQWLMENPVAVTGRILAALTELNGSDLVPEELEGNFAPGPNGVSSSD